MNKPNISPGEWERKDNLIFALTNYTGRSTRMAGACPDGINRFSCLIQQDNSEECGGAPKAEIEANARFIAAAPKMAEALEAEEAWRNATGTESDKLRIIANEKRREAMLAAGYEF